uniref:Uncharacterized protein n=1 Tax=Ditylum brightwellii TaxID=49249 RepID=A0A7S2E690_9STRA
MICIIDFVLLSDGSNVFSCFLLSNFIVYGLFDDSNALLQYSVFFPITVLNSYSMFFVSFSLDCLCVFDISVAYNNNFVICCPNPRYVPLLVVWNACILSFSHISKDIVIDCIVRVTWNDVK